MKKEIAIKVEKLSKQYSLVKTSTRLRDFFNISKQLQQKKEFFWALKDVSFELKQGDVLGVIGKNGAGKSTLLKILSQITAPTYGRAEINGRITSLLEVGTGFHPDLSGRENIYLNGAILGMKRSEIKANEEEIIEFSGISSFIDIPVKHYSSGMYVRLAFSVAAHLQTDILLVDEILAVGDMAFRKKCISRMKSISQHGKTVIFTSHNMNAIKRLCGQAILLDQGQIICSGDTQEVINSYVKNQQSLTSIPLKNRKDRYGSGDVRITNIHLYNNSLEIPTSYFNAGEYLKIVFSYNSTAFSILEHLILRIEFVDKYGQILFECNNRISNNIFKNIRPSGELVCEIPKLPFNRGEYFINYFLLNQQILCDELSNAVIFFVESGTFYKTGLLPSPDKGLLVDYSWEYLNSNR